MPRLRRCATSGELDALGQQRPVTDEELPVGAAALTRGYARGFETVEQVARAAAQLALYELPETRRLLGVRSAVMAEPHRRDQDG